MESRPIESHDPALAELMSRARQRVQHLYGLAAAIMVLISIPAVGRALASPRAAGAFVFWLAGCLVILSLGLVWYRSRARATFRLVRALSAGEAVRVVECTRILLCVIPFGWELDVEVGPADEHLSFGFWTEADCRRLQAILLS